MVTADQIIALVDAVVAVDRPEAVVLFGSYAYGTPTDDSDVDLLVVRNYPERSTDAAIAILTRLPLRSFGLDLIVRSREEIRWRVAANDWFLQDVTEQGITLYAADDAGMGAEGRERLHHHLRRPAAAAAPGAV